MISDQSIFFPSRDENRARITMYVASTKYLVSMILILNLKYIFKFFAHTSKNDHESIEESSLCCIESWECICPHATDAKLEQLQMIVHIQGLCQALNVVLKNGFMVLSLLNPVSMD